MISQTLEITVRGTQRSEKLGGLGRHEDSVILIKPGEYSRNFSTIDEVIASVELSSAQRREWIQSIKVDGVDVLQGKLKDIYIANNRDVDTTVRILLRMAMFSHIDYEDLGPWLRGRMYFVK